MSASEARLELACTWRATSSLPTPVSPTIRVASPELATIAMSRSRAFSAALSRISEPPLATSIPRWKLHRDTLAMFCPLLERVQERAGSERGSASAASISKNSGASRRTRRERNASKVSAPTTSPPSLSARPEALVEPCSSACGSPATSPSKKGSSSGESGGNRTGGFRAQDHVEPRMLLARVLESERSRLESARTERREHLVVEAEQARGVARHDRGTPRSGDGHSGPLRRGRRSGRGRSPAGPRVVVTWTTALCLAQLKLLSHTQHQLSLLIYTSSYKQQRRMLTPERRTRSWP